MTEGFRRAPAGLRAAAAPMRGPGNLIRSNEGTLHAQLHRMLVEQIDAGVFKPGDRLPTETELMSIYSVSRSTARRALDELRRANLVERKPGRGTFVLAPKLDATIPYLHSITAEIEQLGYHAGSHLISAHEGRANSVLAKQLRLSVGGAVLFIKRLRTADGRPFYFAESVLNLATFPKLREVDFGSASLSLYKAFERATGRRVDRVTQWLSAVGATAEAAQHLGVEKGSPLLQLERILYVTGDMPVEAVRAWFIGGRYKYYSELRAPSSEPSHDQ